MRGWGVGRGAAFISLRTFCEDHSHVSLSINNMATLHVNYSWAGFLE